MTHVKPPKRAFRTRLPPKVTRQAFKAAFRARLPPKVTYHACKTSIRTRLSKLNERFVSLNERFVPLSLESFNMILPQNSTGEFRMDSHKKK